MGDTDAGFFHIVQLQVENDHYAEIRSIKRLGHVDRNDDDVLVEENERESRELRRDELIQ